MDFALIVAGLQPTVVAARAGDHDARVVLARAWRDRFGLRALIMAEFRAMGITSEAGIRALAGEPTLESLRQIAPSQILADIEDAAERRAAAAAEALPSPAVPQVIGIAAGVLGTVGAVLTRGRGGWLPWVLGGVGGAAGVAGTVVARKRTKAREAATELADPASERSQKALDNRITVVLNTSLLRSNTPLDANTWAKFRRNTEGFWRDLALATANKFWAQHIGVSRPYEAGAQVELRQFWPFFPAARNDVTCWRANDLGAHADDVPHADRCLEPDADQGLHRYCGYVYGGARTDVMDRVDVQRARSYAVPVPLGRRQLAREMLSEGFPAAYEYDWWHRKDAGPMSHADCLATAPCYPGGCVIPTVARLVANVDIDVDGRLDYWRVLITTEAARVLGQLLLGAYASGTASTASIDAIRETGSRTTVDIDGFSYTIATWRGLGPAFRREFVRPNPEAPIDLRAVGQGGTYTGPDGHVGYRPAYIYQYFFARRLIQYMVPTIAVVTQSAPGARSHQALVREIINGGFAVFPESLARLMDDAGVRFPGGRGDAVIALKNAAYHVAGRYALQGQEAPPLPPPSGDFWASLLTTAAGIAVSAMLTGGLGAGAGLLVAGLREGLTEGVVNASLDAALDSALDTGLGRLRQEFAGRLSNELGIDPSMLGGAVAMLDSPSSEVAMAVVDDAAAQAGGLAMARARGYMETLDARTGGRLRMNDDGGFSVTVGGRTATVS